MWPMDIQSHCCLFDPLVQEPEREAGGIIQNFSGFRLNRPLSTKGTIPISETKKHFH